MLKVTSNYNLMLNKNMKKIYLFIILFFIGFSIQEKANAQGNTCALAELLTINGTPDCASNSISTTNDSNASCDVGDGEDVFYQFVGNGETVRVVLGVPTTSPTWDPVLWVYSGTCAAPVTVQCADLLAGTQGESTSTFVATNGVTYYIYIDDHSAGAVNSGNYCISVKSCNTVCNPSPSDNCTDAPRISNNNNYCGNTNGFTADSPANMPSQFCPGAANAINNNGYFSFIASATAASLYMTVAGCTLSGAPTANGIQVAVFSVAGSCSTGQYTSLYCSANTGNNFGGQLDFTGLVVGDEYLVMVDGFSGAACDYSFNAVSGINVGTSCTPAPTCGTPVSVGALTSTLEKCIAACSNSTGILSTITGPCGELTNVRPLYYSFTVPAGDTYVDILAQCAVGNPNIFLFAPSPTGDPCTGTGIIASGCASGGTSGINQVSVTAGSTYVVEVAAGTGSFDLCIVTYPDPSICNVDKTLTVLPTPAPDGSYPPNTAVTFTYTINSYNRAATNWLHGIQPTFGCGWSAVAGNFNALGLPTIQTPPTKQGSAVGGAWVQAASVTGTNGIFGKGWYWDTNDLDTNPGNNFGDGTCQAGCVPGGGTNGPAECGCHTWTVSFTLTTPTCPQACKDLSVSIGTTGDGQSGSWTSLGCVDDLPATLNATLVCIPCPTLSSAPTALSITANSQCVAPCTLTGGIWALSPAPCPANSELQSFPTAVATTGGTDMTVAPTYDQDGPAQTFHVRCVCQSDASVVSPVQTISNTPGVCTNCPPSCNASNGTITSP